MNEAEPILKQIQAPALSLLLRKRCAELAGVSQAELESLMGLSRPGGKRPAAPARSSRKPPTLVRRLIKMVLLRPELAVRLPQQLIGGNGVEYELLTQLVTLANAQPNATPAVLLQGLRETTPPALLAEVSAEAMEVDDAFEIEHDFEGALKQLQENDRQRALDEVLRIAQERGLQALSAEQKTLLQQFRR
jgi:DNA primase